ncbi:MAG: nucleotidyl transferase AbiEii/AbiGii toxin family protein [Sulfuricurvum sp.]|nr:nucleotidyl transferase AbiEii/AbiGii toxin family protein [Sulfuricurvum sp.]
MHPALIKMLEKYDLTNSNSSYDALREILQEIVLLGLYDAGFFKRAAFYGGTALRILHNLPRFSEDLDFSLLENNPEFNLKPYEEDQAVKIKLEVDTNPPLEFETSNVIRLTPRPFSINAFTLPSLYAGKIHAILCRAWSSRPKGRDWYDLVWYIANDVELDSIHLKARLSQSCRYLEENNIQIPSELNKQTVKELLLQRIDSLDVEKAKNDVQPFIKDMREIELWSKEFFLAVIENIKVR